MGRRYIIPHAQGNPSTIARIELETQTQEIPKRMKQRALHRHNRKKFKRDKKKRRAKKCKTTLSEPLIRKYPGYKDGYIRVVTIRNNELQFNNKPCPKGWITPTVRQLVQTHISLVKRLCKYFPIKIIGVEVPKFCFMLMEDGTVRGNDFQNGRMKGYDNVKEYVKARDNNCCVNCGEPALEVHHLVQRHRNGSDLPENLACLCKNCHDKLHKGKLTGENLKKGMFKKYHHLSVLNVASPYIVRELQYIFGEENIFEISGKDTAKFRNKYGLEKTHSMDAAIVAYLTLSSEPGKITEEILYAKQFRRQNRQIVHSTKERTYKLNTTVIAKNRKDRVEQKWVSLETFRLNLEGKIGKTEARKVISQLNCLPSKRQRNDMNRILAGATFEYNGKRYILKGKTAKIYYTAYGNEGQRCPIKKCKIIHKNSGIVFI